MKFSGEETRLFHDKGWWQEKTLGQLVTDNAAGVPEGVAFVEGGAATTWRQYDERADLLASVLACEFEAGDRVVVLFPDGAAVHIAYVAAERAGLVVVGIGWRAGPAEIAHLADLAGARGLVTQAGTASDRIAGALESLRRVEVPERADGEILVDGRPARAGAAPPADRQLGPDDLFMLNSTSGTTGLPKCVMHSQNRWFAFHRLAVEAGGLNDRDVFLSAIPAPYGFGLWTAHFTPGILGCPTTLLPRFSAESLLESIERDGVTVLCCVSTQFIMLLNEAEASGRDLSSLRVMFTGGEAVPYERARQFEDLTAAAVLQFYGSNETGALSRTTLADSQERRLTTAGRLIPEMNVRLFDCDDPGSGRGQPGCRGPLLSLGYWRDPEANAQLLTPDGWMLAGDVVEIDDEGYLRVVGRTSDFIIRGGKNISAAAVEGEVSKHPSVATAAVVGAPDEVFGERVVVFVTLRAGRRLDLEALRSHLGAEGVTREWWPERLIVLDELPRASGGKVAKAELRKHCMTAAATTTGRNSARTDR